MGRILKLEGEGIVNILRRYLMYGEIRVCYEHEYEEYARAKGAELSAAGYNVDYRELDERADGLDSGGRYILGVGGDSIDRALAGVHGRRSIILTRPNILNCINASISPETGYRLRGKHTADCRIIDTTLTPPRDEQAEILGGITAAYQIALDYRLQNYIKCTEIAGEDELSALDEILGCRWLSYGELIDALALAASVIDCGGADLSAAAFIAADLIAADRGMRYGDACLLSATCYLYSAYSLIGCSAGLTLPPDKAAIADSIARLGGMDKRAVVSALGIIPSEVITANDYVIKEYATELKAFIGGRFPLLINICKLWRRLKTDVGREVSRAITIKEILNIVSNASLVGNGYGVLRHYKELGAL